jgi:toxin FitB
MLYIGAVIVAEIRLDIERMAEPWTVHQRRRSAPLSARPMFERRVLPISEGNMLQWRLLIEEGRKIMHTFSQPDPIIGATALEHGLTVVSKDASDYEKARMPAVNPGLAAAGL